MTMTVERAIETETDTRRKYKNVWASSAGLLKDINRNIPTT